MLRGILYIRYFARSTLIQHRSLRLPGHMFSIRLWGLMDSWGHALGNNPAALVPNAPHHRPQNYSWLSQATQLGSASIFWRKTAASIL